MPFLQPAEIQWMYNCQKCLVGCIFDSKMETAVINTSNTGIFISTFLSTGKNTSKIVKNTTILCQNYIHTFQDCHKYINYTYFIFIHLTKKNQTYPKYTKVKGKLNIFGERILKY